MKRFNAREDEARYEFQLTMIDNAGLFTRLVVELRFVGAQLKEAWAALKRGPSNSVNTVSLNHHGG